MEKLGIDLHVHTKNSDGVLTPNEVIDEAVKNGVKYLAIADHDTLSSYNERFFNYAKEHKINIIPAVEISTKYEGHSFHVLGYNIDTEDQSFKNALYHLRNARHEYLKNVGKKLEELGYKIDIEKLDEIESVTKAHIALNVIEQKENAKLLKDTFGHIPAKGEFIEAIMNEGCPAYVKKKTVTPIEASELIHKNGGKAVLAHPVAYTFENKQDIKYIKKLLIDMKADGLEGNYIYVDSKDKVHNHIKKWNNIAKKLNLISTIGSDFHNDDGKRPLIGFPKNKLEPLDAKKIFEELKKTNK